MIGEIKIPESFPSAGAVAGKRVVITGASRGLGALLAHAFSHAGASVALTLDEVVTEIAATRITERGETRADDRVTEAAMEDRKRVGYF